jgi:hypothetical protein
MLATLTSARCAENSDSSSLWNAVELIAYEMSSIVFVTVAAIMTLTADGALFVVDTALESVTRDKGMAHFCATRFLIRDSVSARTYCDWLNDSAMLNETCPNAPDAMKGSRAFDVTRKSGIFDEHMQAQWPVVPWLVSAV